MKRFLTMPAVAVVTVLIGILAGTIACAQNSRGSIVGQVTDPTGAVVPNAIVTVTSTDTGAVTDVKTTGDGFYTAPALLPGGYKISVNAAGFRVFERTGIQLHTQENATINVKLQIGSASTVVTVTAAAPLIDTADASIGQVLSTQEVQDLPTNGGSPLGLRVSNMAR
jgi:hypothetical protein